MAISLAASPQQTQFMMRFSAVTIDLHFTRCHTP
jgi:hypothetical protein